MTKICKKVELSFKALGSAIFMGTVCLYMAIGALLALVSGEAFYYNVPFTFLMQGMGMSMLAAPAWVLCFGSGKPLSFSARYLLVLIILAVLTAVSMSIPAINSTDGHFVWVISGIISTLAFGTTVAVLSNKHFRNTGARCTLLWELS